MPDICDRTSCGRDEARILTCVEPEPDAGDSGFGSVVRLGGLPQLDTVIARMVDLDMANE